jgi:nitrate reductase beta subunit
MDIRSQVSMVFHLDKCIGCHTCSIACKNVWTDRQGTEYMWWNNVETKPGTGYPTRWEDQDRYKGGWEKNGKGLRLRSTGKARIIPNIFHNPHMPSIDDYYEPWTYDYQALFNAPEGDDAISKITGEPIDIESGPNWDDDLGGSQIYAKNDPNLEGLTDLQKEQLSAVERLVMFYLPRICNHCLNPACVASCPSGALYKRGEDGIVLIDQQQCRAPTSTGTPASRRSASSASRAWRPARRPPASTPAWAASAIWACCSTTPPSWKRSPTCPTRSWSKASAT